MANTNSVKQALVTDLLAESSVINQALPYQVVPEVLDTRDGYGDHVVCIYEGTSRRNVNVDASQPYTVVQEYYIMVYARSERFKGSEGEFEKYFDSLNDEVWSWIDSLSKSNRIATVTSNELRVPNKYDQAESFFTDRDEPIQLAKSTYTRFRISTIRKP